MNPKILNHNRAWWASKVKKYEADIFGEGPSLANVNNPKMVTHLFSCGLREGIRTFAFATVGDLEVFLRAHPLNVKTPNPLAGQQS